MHLVVTRPLVQVLVNLCDGVLEVERYVMGLTFSGFNLLQSFLILFLIRFLMSLFPSAKLKPSLTWAGRLLSEELTYEFIIFYSAEPKIIMEYWWWKWINLYIFTFKAFDTFYYSQNHIVFASKYSINSSSYTILPHCNLNIFIVPGLRLVYCRNIMAIKILIIKLHCKPPKVLASGDIFPIKSLH